MFKRIDYITKVTYPNTTTYYFFNKKESILLPIEVNNYNPQYTFPNTHTIMSTIINSLKARYLKTLIYLYQDGKYYCYLKIKKQNKIYDINSNFIDAIELAIYEQKPILVLNKILHKQGFKVTKKMVMDALEINSSSEYIFEY